MPVNPETVPVVVGVGRYTQKKGTPLDEARSPVEIMATAARIAEKDSHCPGLLSSVECVATVESATRTRAKLAQPQGLGVDLYSSMPRSLANACGCSPDDSNCLLTYDGGNSAQWLVNYTADRIAAGEVSSALLSGCEVHSSLMRALKTGGEAVRTLGKRWADDAQTAPAVRVGPAYIETELEKKHGLHVPVRVYPMIENALRNHLGRDLPTHMAEVGKMFSGFSEVAALQPDHSWFPTAHTPKDMIDPASAGNRMVSLPYTKYMCAIMDVDQSAAVIMMSLAEARRCGVAEERLVYLHGCAETIEKEILKRPELHRSPAMKEMGRALTSSANITLDQIGYKDIYSCFPVAVSVVARELGFEATDGHQLTLTGGLPFHGGPGSNYSMHGLVALVDKLRVDPAAYGLITANGGFLSKHAAGIYSCVPYEQTHPDATSWARPDSSTYQQTLDNGPEATVTDTPSGPGKILTYTVTHNGKGMYRAMVIGDLMNTGALQTASA